MTKLFTAVALALTLTSASVASAAKQPAPARLDRTKQETFVHAKKSRHDIINGNTLANQASKNQAARVVNTDGVTPLPSSFLMGTLDGPDGTTWFYTGDLDVEQVTLPGGVATQNIIQGYTFTVYNNNYEQVGTITDQVTIDEAAGETKVGDIQLGTTVTQKFFNTDANYEIMVMLAVNTTQYINNYYTKVYSLGNNTPVQTIPGYEAASVNSGTWSEEFYITFFNEVWLSSDDSDDSDETDLYNRYETYTRATWSSPNSATVLKTIDIPYGNIEGNNGPSFLPIVRNGQPYFLVAYYEKPFFASRSIQIGDDGEPYMDMTPTPDNNFVLTLYNKQFSAVKTTSIPMETTEDHNVSLKFYEIGTLDYTDDISFGFWNESTDPAYTVTVDTYYMATDGDLFSYYAFDAEGNKLATIIEDTSGSYLLSDIPGQEKQHVFTDSGQESFIFVNTPSCTKVTEISGKIMGNALTTELDRYPVGDSYQYAIGMSASLNDDEGSDQGIAWYTTDGELDHIERVPIGDNIAISQAYISQTTLSPYLFNTDEYREYPLLVKRYIGTGSETTESFRISSTNGETILELGESETMGEILSIMFVNMDTTPTMWIIYYSYDTDLYSSVFHSLPLAKFNAGGDGSEANPYLISTPGDLDAIRYELNAHYKLANDIDMSGMQLTPIGESFTGTLNGDNHIIKNLRIDGSSSNIGLFSSLGANAKITDLNLIGVDIAIDDDNTYAYAGVIAGSSIGGGEEEPAEISDVHVYGLNVTGTDVTFGGIVGSATFYSYISLCSVAEADINIPESSPVGGIVGTMRTSSSVNACSFSGKITASTTVGGIAGEISSDTPVTNCRVNADITAENTIGGIVGSSSRALIGNNYVAGTITATENENWGSGAKTGGIVGELSSNWSYNPESPAWAVKGNVVALTSITVPELPEDPEYPAEATTAHRIVGWSCANEYPEPIGYDDQWNPIYSDEPVDPDHEIADNYAVSALAVIEEAIAAEAGTTEGASIDTADMTEDFFEGLGFSFGTTADAPWAESSAPDVRLFFDEVTLALSLNPTELSLEEGESAVIVATFAGGDAEYLTVESSDNAIASITGQEVTGTGELSLTIKCETAGTATITVKAGDLTATCIVTGTSGIDEIATGDSRTAIIYDGTTVKAEGCAIVIYNIAGNKLAEGFGSVSTTGLVSGVYVVTAQNAETTISAKIAVK